LREAWGARYPGVVALWAGDSGAFLRFYGYPKVLWPYLRSTNLMERFIRNPPDPFPQHPPGHQWKRVWLRIRPGWVCR
jgi:hypothetical protein